ncbi:hypothetical protein [Sinorhizobium sp. BG8]|uniref:hypothetical protein n=1 Tax=Sinorhizobium sp. BG8 TaxID=2613773 RepID=UPI00193EB55E|nr:hypothetical protein [Sinorhizobium sp. BG8]
MHIEAVTEKSSVAARLRPVVYVYAAVNIAVATLLVTTVSFPGPASADQQVVAMR